VSGDKASRACGQRGSIGVDRLGRRLVQVCSVRQTDACQTVCLTGAILHQFGPEPVKMPCALTCWTGLHDNARVGSDKIPASSSGVYQEGFTR
jgi:hypothetical protein